MSQIGFAYSIGDFGETKIDDFDFQLSCLSIGPSDHDIARLQIAVDQTLDRRRNQRPRNLGRDFQSELWLKWAITPHASLQGFALDQFHRVIAAIDFRRSAELKYAGHIRMLQCRRRSRLAPETFAYRLRATSRGRGLDYFQRHGAVQHFICRAISHAHRAATQFPQRTIFAPRNLEITED